MTCSVPSDLKLHRLKNGVTQFVIAKRAHISPARLSLLERGYDDPTPAERTALAAALGTTESALFPASPGPDRTAA